MSTCGCNGNRNATCCTVDSQFFANCANTGSEIEAEQACSAITGVDSIVTLNEAWTNNNCPQIYQDVLYLGPDGNLAYNSANVSRVQAEIDNMIQTYMSYGFDFTETVTSPSYNQFQEKIIDLCSSPLVPGGCDLFLQNYCQGYTYDDISTDSALASLCGCYINSPYYQLPLTDGSTLPPQCQPLCHIVNTAQIADTCTGVIDSCDNTVCVIDNVNIDLVNTSASTAFQQICPACTQAGDDPCTCIIGGTNVTTTLEDSGAGANYTQFCGENAECYILEPSGSLTPTTCPDPSDFGFQAPSYTLPILLGIIILVIVVILIIVFFATKGNNRYVEKPGMWQQDPNYRSGYTSSLQFRS